MGDMPIREARVSDTQVIARRFRTMHEMASMPDLEEKLGSAISELELRQKLWISGLVKSRS